MTDANMSAHWTYVEAAQQAHEAALNEIWSAVKKVKRDASLTPSERKTLLTELYKPLSSKDVKGFTADDIHEYRLGVSFRASISHLRHVKAALSSNGYALSLGDNPKMRDRAFARALGIPTPITLVQAQLPGDLPIVPGTVLKPIRGAGATGVFYVDNNSNIRSFKSGRRYRNIGDALTELNGRPVVNEPVWLAEEAILNEEGEPAHDLKVYMFYGEPAFIMEIVRGQGEGGAAAYCFYDPNGSVIDMGRQNTARLLTTEIPQDLFNNARTLSLESPVPFLRLDFHRGADTSYLGEITPHPGDTYAGDFYDEVDKRLGELFLKAEARLMIDLLNGKTFETYFTAYDACSPR